MTASLGGAEAGMVSWGTGEAWVWLPGSIVLKLWARGFLKADEARSRIFTDLEERGVQPAPSAGGSRALAFGFLEERKWIRAATVLLRLSH